MANKGRTTGAQSAAARDMGDRVWREFVGAAGD